MHPSAACMTQHRGSDRGCFDLRRRGLLEKRRGQCRAPRPHPKPTLDSLCRHSHVTTVPFQSLGVQVRRPTVRQRHWPFNLPKAASMIMRAVTTAIMIKKFVVRISCVSVARHKPWSERICSIAVYVIASVSKIAHCVYVEGGIVHDLAIRQGKPTSMDIKYPRGSHTAAKY